MSTSREGARSLEKTVAISHIDRFPSRSMGEFMLSLNTVATASQF